MSAITTAYQERPRIAMLWTLVIVAAILGAYFIVRGLDSAGDDRSQVESDLARTQTQLEQANNAATAAAAQRDQLAAKLQVRARRIRRLENRVDALSAQLAQARQPARGH